MTSMASDDRLVDQIVSKTEFSPHEIDNGFRMTVNVFNSATLGEPVKELRFQYKNWRGETSVRKALPIKIWYGKTDWHPDEQWFLKAIDTEKGEERDFALIDMKFVEGTD